MIESYKDYFALFIAKDSYVDSSKFSHEEFAVIEKLMTRVENEILKKKFSNALTLYSNIAEINMQK